MAVVNSRAVVSAIEMYGVTAIRLASTLGTNLNQLIKSLFANGEQGFFYDPNDLATMFQDAVGTVPVTDAGQPVGLVLDKSKGLILGDNIIKNGNFDNLDFWLANGTVGVDVASNKLTLTRYVTSDSVSQELNTDIGGYYKVEVLGTPIQSDSARLAFGPFNSIINSQNTIVSRFSGKNSFIFKATTTTSYLLFGAASNGDVIEYSDISVKKVSGNHAHQTTSAARPILRQNAVTGANYLEFDGVDDHLALGPITIPLPFSHVMALESKKPEGTQALLSGGAPGYLLSVGDSSFGVQQNAGNPTMYTLRGKKDVITHSAYSTVVTLKSNLSTATRNDLVHTNPYIGNSLKYIGTFNDVQFSTAARIDYYGGVFIRVVIDSNLENELRAHFNKRIGI